MKKKILGFLLWGILLLGVIYLIFFQDKNIGYQFSELSYEKWDGVSKAYRINGSIKNISNNICDGKELSVEIELKSGSIKDTTYIYISNPSIGEIESFEDIIFTDLTNFQIKIKEVNCWIDEDTK